MEKVESVEIGTAKEAAAWLLSDVCSFYLLLALREALTPILGYVPFRVPPTYYGKGVEFFLVVSEIAIVTTHIFRKPEGGIVTVQVPLSLSPEGFYTAVTFNKGSEMVLGLNDTYPAVVRSLEQVIALSKL